LISTSWRRGARDCLASLCVAGGLGACLNRGTGWVSRAGSGVVLDASGSTGRVDRGFIAEQLISTSGWDWARRSCECCAAC